MEYIRTGRILLVVGLLPLCIGCSGRPTRINPPGISAGDAGDQAIRDYDRDGDGQLSNGELAKCPGILAALEHFDTNSDGSVSGTEITKRIEQWQETGVGIMSFVCTVRLDGRPLQGAQIKLIPESFLGEAVKPALGTSDQGGVVAVSISEEDLPKHLRGRRIKGVHCGVYKIQVTHDGSPIPARYNKDTELGHEIAADVRKPQHVVFDLKSR